MRKHLAGLALAFAAILSPLAAQAELSGNEYPHTAPYKNYTGGTTGTLVIAAQPLELVAIVNANAAAQTVTFTCYDNASAASGLVLWSGILGASQIVTFPGVQSINGITCSTSGATVAGAGILVLSR